MHLTTNDGQTFTGTPQELMTQLRTAARLQIDIDDLLFKHHVARRVQLWNGAQVSTAQARTFLEDLHAAGVITLAEEA